MDSLGSGRDISSPSKIRGFETFRDALAKILSQAAKTAGIANVFRSKAVRAAFSAPRPAIVSDQPFFVVLTEEEFNAILPNRSPELFRRIMAKNSRFSDAKVKGWGKFVFDERCALKIDEIGSGTGQVISLEVPIEYEVAGSEDDSVGLRTAAIDIGRILWNDAGKPELHITHTPIDPANVVVHDSFVDFAQLARVLRETDPAMCDLMPAKGVERIAPFSVEPANPSRRVRDLIMHQAAE